MFVYLLLYAVHDLYENVARLIQLFSPNQVTPTINHQLTVVL